MSAALEVDKLVKSYGTVKAVDGISFEVVTGETFGMLGPNGAGKTTTVEIIEGLRLADSGNISVLGMDISRVPDAIKQRIGVQLQAPSLLPLVTVYELLDLFTSFYRRSLPVKTLLKKLSLEESCKVLVKNLSGGQQQRLSVALALINDPDIAFLDEPTTGLDPQARRNLWSVIEEMRSQGKTVFLTTHYMEEAEKLCDRVAIIDHGKIITLGSPAELIRNYFQESAIEFEMDAPPGKEVFQKLAGATLININGPEIIIYSTNIPATMSGLLNYAENSNVITKLKSLRVRQATLEDVFLKLTGRKIRE